MMALRGMPSKAASSGSCTMTRPPFSFTAFNPETAVGARPREDRADGALAAFFGQRAQEEVEGHARAVALQGLGEAEGAALDCQIGARWNEIYAVARELHPVCRLQNLHWRVASEQIDHQALVRRIEMLDQHEGHAAVGRQRVEELLEGVQTTGRGPQCNDREVNTRRLRRRAPVRLRSGLAGL